MNIRILKRASFAAIVAAVGVFSVLPPDGVGTAFRIGAEQQETRREKEGS